MKPPRLKKTIEMLQKCTAGIKVKVATLRTGCQTGGPITVAMPRLRAPVSPITDGPSVTEGLTVQHTSATEYECWHPTNAQSG